VVGEEDVCGGEGLTVVPAHAASEFEGDRRLVARGGDGENLASAQGLVAGVGVKKIVDLREEVVGLSDNGDFEITLTADVPVVEDPVGQARFA